MSNHYQTLLDEVQRDRAEADADASRKKAAAEQAEAKAAKLRDLEEYLAGKVSKPVRQPSPVPVHLDYGEQNGTAHATVEGGTGSLVDQIAVILLQAGRAMRGADVTRALAQRGAKTTAKDGLLPMTLSSLRRRSDLFAKIDRGTYQLTEKGANHAKARSGISL